MAAAAIRARNRNRRRLIPKRGEQDWSDPFAPKGITVARFLVARIPHKTCPFGNMPNRAETDNGCSVGDRDTRTREFVALLTRYSGRIYSFIRTLVPSHIDADNVFQEVSATMWEKFGQFRKGSDFRAWAFQIVRYKVLSFRKVRSHVPQLFDDELLQRLADEHLVMDDELDASYRALADCYQKLSEEDRRLLDLRYLEAASVSTVAAQVGRSVDFVYKALRRIHGWLYRCVDERVEGGDR